MIEPNSTSIRTTNGFWEAFKTPQVIAASILGMSAILSSLIIFGGLSKVSHEIDNIPPMSAHLSVPDRLSLNFANELAIGTIDNHGPLKIKAELTTPMVPSQSSSGGLIPGPFRIKLEAPNDK